MTHDDDRERKIEALRPPPPQTPTKTDAPAPAPLPTRKDRADFLRRVICKRIAASDNCVGRQAFSVLLNCVNRDAEPLPSLRKDGRSDLATECAAFAALLIQAIVALRQDNMAHPVFTLLVQTQDHRCRLVGNAAIGYTLEAPV